MPNITMIRFEGLVEQMTLVATEQLEPGMTTLKNVVNQRGQVLLPKNIQLNDKHIRGLRSWSIKFIDVLQSGEDAPAELTEDQLQLVQQQITIQFTLNAENDSDFFVQKLKELHHSHLLNNFEHPQDSIDHPKIDEPAAAEKWLTVQHIIQQTKTVHTIPAVRRKLISLMNRPDASIAELSQYIATDASMSSRLIKMANSAFYGSNHRLETVLKAATVVGFEDIKTFVNETPELVNFSESPQMNTDLAILWKHNLAVAIFTRLIAQEVRHPDVEHLAVLGLLHDIGKILLFTQLPDQYAQIHNFSRQQNVSSMKVERKTFGFYHNLLSMELLKHWNYSKTSQEIVYYHHTPENAAHKREAYILHLADLLAHATGFSGHSNSFIPVIDTNTLDEIPLRKKRLDGIVAQAQQQIEEISRTMLP